jgi:hypothetical protein
MDGLRITVNSRRLLFASNGNVADTADEQVKGAWTAESQQQQNQIRYTLGGAEQEPLKARYAFTKRNQLQVTAGDGAVSGKFVFPGRIEIDSNHNFRYLVIDAQGKDTGAVLVLYGDISFAEDTVNLNIALAGGGSAVVTGASGIQSLEAVKNHSAAFDADDLLTFHAKTVNVFDGVQDPVVKPAILDMVGSWTIQGGTVAFLSQVKSAPTGNTVNIGFAGKFKAVTAGFVYFADRDGSKAVLNIRGRHVYKGGAGELSWQTTIGFSEKAFDAQVNVRSFTPISSSQSLTIEGTLAVKGEKSKSVSFDLSLAARYEFQGGFLVFKANISSGIQPSYDLMLMGDFQYSNLALTFQIAYSNAANARRATVDVGVRGNRESMIRMIALMLDVSESDAKLKLDLTLEAHIVFKNGVRVKEVGQPAALRAAAGGSH